MQKILLSILIFVFISCSSNKNESNEVILPVKTPVSLSGCYQMIIENDTATLKIVQQNDSISGDLIYNRYEKDDNTGRFAGKITDDKIIGWYTFNSEGIISIRQVIFKIDSTSLYEGYGDIEQRNDSAIFSYPQTLDYETKHPFLKTDCK